MIDNTIQLREILIHGHSIFYRYRPGSSDVFISFLHGYPTSSLDYVDVIDSIPDEYNVIAHDHLGFGQSDKPLNNDYLFTSQADIACKLYESIGAKRIHIIAHDYGTSVATEIVARHNENLIGFEICSVTLSNGSMLIEMADLRIIQKLLKSKLFGSVVAKLSTASTFHRNMKNIWFDKNLYQKDEMQMHWTLLVSNNGMKVLPQITRYIDQRYTNYDRWIGALKQSELPFHILWANDDPVAVVGMASKLHSMIKNSKLSILYNCGHYPMIEQGRVWIRQAIGFIDR